MDKWCANMNHLHQNVREVHGMAEKVQTKQFTKPGERPSLSTCTMFNYFIASGDFSITRKPPTSDTTAVIPTTMTKGVKSNVSQLQSDTVKDMRLTLGNTRL